METKANYIVTGLFTLAVIVGAFGFIFWFQNAGGNGNNAAYRVVFDGSVSGLRNGAAVTFNGIRVGEVADLALDARDPRKVVALLKLDRAVPVRADTKAGLAFQGLTGLAEVSLTGGSVDAAPLAAQGGQLPTLYADASATADVTQQARDVLAHIDGMVAENEAALHLSLRNIETVTTTLAANSQRLDHQLTTLDIVHQLINILIKHPAVAELGGIKQRCRKAVTHSLGGRPAATGAGKCPRQDVGGQAQGKPLVSTKRKECAFRRTNEIGRIRAGAALRIQDATGRNRLSGVVRNRDLAPGDRAGGKIDQNRRAR